MSEEPVKPPRYTPPANPGGPSKCLLFRTGVAEPCRFVFCDRLEIGRDDGLVSGPPGLLLIPAETVSRRHCVLTLTRDGKCLVRDVSRNGTRLDGRRLVPSVEQEMQVGQRLTIAPGYEFVLVDDCPAAVTSDAFEEGATVGGPSSAFATILVGDIGDYTGLVRRAPSVELQQSVKRVFEMLSDAVVRNGGTVKEFQGDAILAFWEGDLSGKQAIAACRAAVALDQLACRMAADRSIWQMADFPLKMQWALATGLVVIDSFGGLSPKGLSLIGESVVLAFRLEKFASDKTGRILACPVTRAAAQSEFSFRDLGPMTAQGFERPDHVFALDLARAAG